MAPSDPTKMPKAVKKLRQAILKDKELCGAAMLYRPNDEDVRLRLHAMVIKLHKIAVLDPRYTEAMHNRDLSLQQLGRVIEDVITRPVCGTKARRCSSTDPQTSRRAVSVASPSTNLPALPNDSPPVIVIDLRDAILQDKILTRAIFYGITHDKYTDEDFRLRLHAIVFKLDKYMLFEPRYTKALQSEELPLYQVNKVIEAILRNKQPAR